MALSAMRPTNEANLTCQTTSIGATPVAACIVMTNAGYIQRVMAAAGGTTTGTITVAVTVNASATDIASSALTIAAGSNARAGTVVEIPLPGAGSTSGVYVNEGDVVTFTPSGGGGASIIGSMGLVVRTI